MAYGISAPFGLRPSKMLSGATFNGVTNEYPIKNTAGTGYATSLFTGDPVTLLADGSIGIGVAGAAIVGVFQGCKYITASGTYVQAPYWPASTLVQTGSAITAFVVDDPNVVFDIQSSSVAGSPIGVTPADLNADANFIAGAGSTITGQSGFSLDTSAYNGAATNNLKILAFTPVPTNPISTTATLDPYNNVLVIINNHILKGGTGTAGV